MDELERLRSNITAADFKKGARLGVLYTKLAYNDHTGSQRGTPGTE